MFGFLQIFCQSIEPLLPETPVTLDPINRFFHGSGDKAAAAHAPVLFLPEQAGPLQHAQVLGDGRQRDVERLCQPHHRRGAPRQPRQHGPPGGVGQGRKSGVQRSLAILNHVVKYSRPAPLVKQNFAQSFMR